MTKVSKKGSVLNSRKMPEFHIDIDKSGRALSFFCSAVKVISELSDEKIVLRLASFSVSVFGEKLNISVFENRAVQINGKILEVKFFYGEN